MLQCGVRLKKQYYEEELDIPFGKAYWVRF